LNYGSTLRYARRFGTERVVHLAGEAFFDVEAEERPFIVETFNARVRVLGTRFNVRAWQQSLAPGTSVTVASGRVALVPADRPTQAVTLAPGQAHRIAREVHTPAMPDTATVAQATAWRAGDLVYKGEWLGVIFEDIERRFAITVGVRSPALLTTDVTLAVRNPTDAESVIRDLCIALNLNYRATSGGYEIYQTIERVEPGDSI
jgi:ferric-dicitrate binding protein FerR (iron transport regulator)